MNETEAEALKIIRDQLVLNEGRLYEHMTTTFRWLMATLFAANGGAIIGLLASNPGVNFGSLSWFAAGLVLSILMGILSTVWTYLAMSPTANARGAIEQSLLTGEINKEPIDKLLAHHKTTWKTWVPSYAGGASFVCLIFGMIAFACRL